MAKVIVYHSDYGCETGCCGHVVEMGDQSEFLFDHPYRSIKPSPQTLEAADREFICRCVTEAFGAEHCADIDFSQCIVIDD